MSATLDHDAVAAKLGPYFDGELPPDEERAVLDHLADCERCAAALDDLMGLHVALGRRAGAAQVPSPVEAAPTPVEAAPRPAAPPAPIIPLAPRQRRAPWLAGGLVLAAAAAAVVVWAPWRGRRAEVRLALGDTRPVEVRFTAPDFDRHRPYRVERGASGPPPVSLGVLSRLEQVGDRAGLLAGLVWSGDRTRARAILDGTPSSAQALADRAALAVVAGEAEAALEAADQALALDGTLVVARWNRALALAALDLPLAAALELDRVAAAGEPGWADEARTRAQALRDGLSGPRARIDDAATRRRAALAGGPPLTVADVASAPLEVRTYVHEALRTAGEVQAVDELAPLAAALDADSGGTYLQDEVARLRASDLAARARFAPRYLAVSQGKASPAEVEALVADLSRAGASFDDLRLGTILAAGQLGARLDEVEALVSPLEYPLFRLLPVQARMRAAAPRTGDLALADRLCARPAWGLRCGTIDRWHAWSAGQLGRRVDAEALARRAIERLHAASAPHQEDDARALLAEIVRERGRLGLAAAMLEELRARAGDADCKQVAFFALGQAEVERRRGRLAVARAALAASSACPAAVDAVAVGTAVDLARDSGEALDREAAARWIDAARVAGLPARLLAVADARLHIEDQADRARPVLVADLATPATDELGRATRDWAARTLIADDGRRGDWKAAFDHTLAALDQAGPTTCALALASDDAIHTAAWRDATGTAGGAQWRDPTPWPPLPATALAGCTTTAVLAMSPLHGRPPPWKLGAWAWSTGRAAATSTAPPSQLVVAATAPPRELLELPPLAPVAIPAGARGLTGADATPRAIAAALATATYVEVHAHGLVDLDTDDGGFLALSPDADGDWKLSASDLRGLHLAGAPVVVLAACRAAEAAPDQLRRWSLPDAFLAAGARAVIAADVAVPDDLIRAFVDDVRARLGRGEAPVAAAAAARAALVAGDPTRASWVDRLMVFE